MCTFMHTPRPALFNNFLRIFVVLKSTNYRLKHAGMYVCEYTHGLPPSQLTLQVNIIRDLRELWMTGEKRGLEERRLEDMKKFILRVEVQEGTSH